MIQLIWSISTYYQGIINSLQASLHLQVYNSRRNSRIPNWSAVLKNSHKKAKTSYLTWINSSKPKTGPVFELMKKHKKELKKLGSGYFAVDGNLPSETILP